MLRERAHEKSTQKKPQPGRVGKTQLQSDGGGPVSMAMASAFLDAMPGGAMLLGVDHRIVCANKSVMQELGCALDEVIGRPCYEVMHGGSKAPPDCTLNQCVRTGREIETEHEDGDSGCWFAACCYPTEFTDSQGDPVYLHTRRDITSSLRMRDELRGVAKELLSSRERVAELARITIQSQESEREYLAGEIHDRLLQNLAAISFFVEALDPKGMDESALARKVELQKALQQSIGEGRELLREIAPPPRAEDIFRESLVTACSLALGDTKTALTLDVPEDLPGLDRAFKTNLLRILQEAVVNTRKHADARRVWISVSHSPDRSLSMEVRDDGRGFDTSTASGNGNGHIGLSVMERRADLFGGKLTLSSKVNEGTAVRAYFGLSDEPIPRMN